MNVTDPMVLPAPERWATRWIRPLAVSSLVVNILIVVTGGVVRLTSSGLGCPTWPHCEGHSFVPHRALGIHGAIEFSNRMVTFLLAAVAIATFVAAWRYGRPAVLRLAFVLVLAVPAQAVIGGITVLTDLNPWIVAFHLLVSLAMIGVAVVLLRRLDEGDGPALPTVPGGVAWVVRAAFLAGWAVLYAGTVVTGSGPHAGAAAVPRNGLDPRALSQLHSDLVFLLVGLTLASVLVLRAVDAPARAQRAAALLLGVEVAQAAIGFAQYFTGLPVILVSFHLLGAALLSAAMTYLLVGIRDRA
jgi:cytochrome c oxidase assembly protein subunit 15